MDERVQHVKVPPVSLALQLLHSTEVHRESQAHHTVLCDKCPPNYVAC